jgi:hypothetical protein
VLSSQQTSAQLHRHILVVYHLHSGDILFHPVGLEQSADECFTDVVVFPCISSADGEAFGFTRGHGVRV